MVTAPPQLVMNGIRLGIYEPIKHSLPDGLHHTAASVVAGGAAGLIGAACGSPLSLAKIRLQSLSPDPELAVGFQHNQHSIRDVFRHQIRTEGIGGLWRGASASMAR